jgi:molybdopterin-guanine dinucleotide biosynthesis protein A
MPTYLTIAAIILAGGKSSRMGTDKGLVEFEGKPLVHHVIDHLQKVTRNIIIITQHGSYEQFGLPCYPDLYSDKGALGGIYTGLHYSNFQKNIVVGCDMPFLSERLLQALINSAGNEDALITEHNGKAEPLCSVYDKNCEPQFKSLIQKDQLKITDALKGLHIRTISFDQEPWFKGNEFANLNSMEELMKYQNQNDATTN